MISRLHTAHKTPDGTRLQVEAGPGVSSLVTSTLPEVWGVLESGLVADGKVVDVSVFWLQLLAAYPCCTA